MTELEPYPTAKGVEDAIKAAARRASAVDPSLTTDQRIRLEYFNRDPVAGLVDPALHGVATGRTRRHADRVWGAD